MTKKSSILAPIAETFIVLGITATLVAPFQMNNIIEEIHNRFSKTSLESIASATEDKKSQQKYSLYDPSQPASYTVDNTPIVAGYKK